MPLIPETVNVPVTNPSKLRVTIMGQPKSGKSSFAVQNPKAIVMDTDNEGTQFLKCFRVSVTDWVTFGQALAELAKPENKDRFDTIVIDTVDMLWQRCREYVCNKNGVNHESEDKGFGRLWDLVRAEFMRAMAFISKNGWGVWLITHTVQKEVKVQGIKRQVTTTTLPANAARVVMAMSDVITYLDVNEDGTRTLCVKAEDTLECGDRTGHLKENIRFNSPDKGYNDFVGTFTKE